MERGASPKPKPYKRFFSLLLILPLLSACEEESRTLSPQIRAIKAMTVTEVASGQVRTFSGLVQATNSSTLSFEVSGKVADVKVDIGATVKQGDVLALLDKQPFMLALQGSEAELAKAQAQAEKARLDYDRQKKLYDKQWVAKAAFDQARASYDSARSSVSFARSQLNLARRDLDNTLLTAPYDGTVAGRFVDPFQEVKSGEALFELNASGALEVLVDIPETIIERVTVGTSVIVTSPTSLDLLVEGRVSEVGTAAGDTNAFPVQVGLINPPASLRAGMTAEASFTFERADNQSGYLIPLTAIVPGEEQEERRGYVFRYDPASSQLQKTPIRASDVRDNLIVVSEGLKAGDIIATAGVSFLHDAQEVTLLDNP